MNDIAHLAHVEVHTDKYDESLDFFTRVYGLSLSAEDETSAYLRAWDDYPRTGEGSRSASAGRRKRSRLHGPPPTAARKRNTNA